MGDFFAVDWSHLFIPDTPLLEIFLRGTFVYLGLFLLLRIILKRETGTVGITDLLVVVLLAEAAQNALADDYRSIPDGMLLILTIIFWNYTLNWLGYRFPRIQKWIHPPPLMLVENGQILQRNMRKEFITEDELLSMLRQQGVDEVSKVKKAYMEGDGRISVITADNGNQTHQEPERRL